MYFKSLPYEGRVKADVKYDQIKRLGIRFGKLSPCLLVVARVRSAWEIELQLSSSEFTINSHYKYKS